MLLGEPLLESSFAGAFHAFVPRICCRRKMSPSENVPGDDGDGENTVGALLAEAIDFDAAAAARDCCS